MRKRSRRRLRWPPGGAGRAESSVGAADAGRSEQQKDEGSLGEELSRTLAQQYTRQAFKALASVMGDGKAAATARVNAANTILEWGHGKRGETASAPAVIEKVVEMGWAEEE